MNTVFARWGELPVLFKRYLLISLGIVGVGIAMMIYGMVNDPPTSFLGASQMVGGAGFLLLGWGCRVVPQHLPQRPLSAFYILFGLFFVLMGSSFEVGFNLHHKSVLQLGLLKAAFVCVLAAIVAAIYAIAAQGTERNRRS